MGCDICGGEIPLDELVRDQPNEPGRYNCKDCHAESYAGMIYRPVMPFNAQKRNSGGMLGKLLKWAFGTV